MMRRRRARRIWEDKIGREAIDYGLDLFCTQDTANESKPLGTSIQIMSEVS